MEHPQVVRVEDAQEAALKVAERMVAVCKCAVDRGQERIRVVLAGGTTPYRAYTLLCNPPYSMELPWSRLDFFLGDERYVPYDDSRHNGAHIFSCMESMLSQEGCTWNPIQTAHTLLADARSYGNQLEALYGAPTLDPKRPLFDLVLLGFGEDGHTASLFPGKHRDEGGHPWVVIVPEAGLEPFVPRISMNADVLSSAREVLFMVTGARKKPKLKAYFKGEVLPVSEICPKSGTVTWIIDREADPGVNDPALKAME